MPSSQNSHQNNFDLLRLFAALCVFASHLYLMYALKEPLIMPAGVGRREITLGSLGVTLFFTISGYLIAQSWALDPRARAFVVKRLLRIYPAMLLYFVVLCFGIGLLATELAISGYIQTLIPKLPRLFAKTLIFFHLDVPGLFTHNPMKLINGSLWTLHYEIACYAAVLACGLTKRFRSACVLTVFIFALSNASALLSTYTNADLGRLHCAAFALGALAYLFSLDKYVNVKAGSIALITLVTMHFAGWVFLPLYLLATACLTLLIALRATKLKAFRPRADLSYGIYIYSFPVQQACAAYFNLKPEDFVSYTLLSLFITLALAGASWYMVEKPALRLKSSLIKPPVQKA